MASTFTPLAQHMRSPSRSWLRAIVLAPLLVLLGCAAPDEADTGGSAASVPVAEAQTFRDIFYTYLKAARYSDDQARLLALLPTEDALRERGSLAEYDAAYRTMRPRDFHAQSRRTPPVERAVGRALRRRPVHFVIVPGMFSELIPDAPFEEVLRAGGAARARWDRDFRAREAAPHDPNALLDTQYSNAALGEVARPIHDLVRVGSLDDEDGTPLVTLTYLRPEVGSLETLGVPDASARRYVARLEKYFAIAGLPEDIHLLGYSRGAPVALSLLVQARKANAAWAARVRGVVSLAGILYGTAAADFVFDPARPEKKLFDVMARFVEGELESCTEPSIGVVARNSARWSTFVGRLVAATLALPDHGAAFEREGLETAGPDAAGMATLAKRALFGRGESGDGESAFSALRLGEGVTFDEYCRNVTRFKTLARATTEAIYTLTTASRGRWFGANVLPGDVRYYALTATMGDATTTGAPSPLATNAASYDARSIDHRSLRTAYYDLFEATGEQLQDGRVAVQRGRFLPDIHAAMNPAQPPLRTHFMGTVGAHHFGLSFPRAMPTNDGADANPFPRTLLLRAMATFVAETEAR